MVAAGVEPEADIATIEVYTNLPKSSLVYSATSACKSGFGS